jgi:uncharacterized protein YijF (DUF1287 family)
MKRIAVLLLQLLTMLLRAESVDGPGLVTAARAQIGITVRYDPAYVTLKYPGGDVPPDRGVCTDVLIRAMRSAWKMDLQQVVHEDMARNFSAYPKLWGLRKTDRSIDHRRVPNLATCLRRKGWALPVTKAPEDYRPGDIVTCTVPPNLPHVMIVSDRTGPGGHPLVLHNIGEGTREEDCLFRFPLTGHYRRPPQRTPKPPADAPQAGS